MPIIAVGIAIGASVFAASTVAAVGIASVAGALAVTAAVGATLSAVGMLTKNKALSMAGMVIGAVGAIGSFASAVGLIDGSAQLFGTQTAAAVADQGGAVGAMAGEAGTWDTGVSAVGDAVGPGTGSAIANAADPAASLGGEAGAWDTGVGSASAASSTAPFAGDQTILTSTSESVADPATQLATAPTGAADPGTGVDALLNADTTAGTPLPPTPPSTVPGPGTAPTAGQTPGSWAWGVDKAAGTATIEGGDDGGILSSLLGFARKNPTVALGAIQSAGSFLSGATSSLTPAQVTALQAQAAANDAATALTNQQRANLAMPKSVASLSPVTGTPQQLVPTPTPPAGFINQVKPMVTGVPA
jgi:hypothetical protein